jgi:methylmalonyl-CoA epimerase
MAVTGTDHLVLLVADIEEGIRSWSALGMTLTHRADLPDAGLAQAFFLLGDGTFLELVSPTNADSHLHGVLESRGEGVHVVALAVDDLDAAVASLRERGVRLIGEGTPQVFVHPGSANGVLVQLWPVDRPHRWQAAPSEVRPGADRD